MKTSKLLTLMIAMTLSLVSCEDILTENPNSFVTVENFFKSKEDGRAAVNATYSWLYTHWVTFLPAMSGTDIAFAPTVGPAWSGHNYNSEMNPTWGLNWMWDQAWRGVALANSAIKNIPKIPEEKNVLDPLVAEAKFLRAFYYYQLANFYGDLPIVTEPATSLEEILEGQVRKPVAEVYKQVIIPDLIAAAKDLPATHGDSDRGRANSGAAGTLLAKVYAIAKQWPEVIEATDAVINSGKYDLFADYSNLWSGKTGEFSSFPNKTGALVRERIWDVQYKTNVRGSQIHTQFGDGNTDIKNPKGGWGNVLSTYDWLNSFDPADKRLKTFFFESDKEDPDKKRTRFSNKSGSARGYTKKYIDPKAKEQVPNNGGPNINVLRYADVLLLRAEAENELNGPAGAYKYINAVRERAGLPGLSGLTKETFIEAIIHERAWELGMEGHRRFDLNRWGILGSKVNAIKEDELYRSLLDKHGFKPHYVRLPIPQAAIDAAKGKLKQNKGY